METVHQLRRMRATFCDRYRDCRRRHGIAWLRATLAETANDASTREFESELRNLLNEATTQAQFLGMILSVLNHQEQKLKTDLEAEIDELISTLAADLNRLSDTMIYLRPDPAACPLREARLALNTALRSNGLQM